MVEYVFAPLAFLCVQTLSFLYSVQCLLMLVFSGRLTGNEEAVKSRKLWKNGNDGRMNGWHPND